MSDLLILKAQFYAAISSSFENFKRKLSQQQYFQIQTILIDKIVSEIKTKPDFINNNLIIEFDKFNIELIATGKSYHDVLNEKLFCDKFRFFEELLFDFFHSIFSLLPKFLIDPNDDRISVRFYDVFEVPNIANCKLNVIESKIKKIIQGSNVMEIIKKITNVFKIPISISDDELKNCFRISQIRNIITHNNGYINSIYQEQLTKFGIPIDYQIGISISPSLQDEIAKAHNILLDVGTKLQNNIMDDFVRLKMHHDNK